MKGLRPGHRIAVTGANGFIGAHCVVALLRAGFEVVAIVRDPTNSEKTGFLKEQAGALGKEDRLLLEAGDLLVGGSYDAAFQGCHGVLHTAAVVEVDKVQDPMAQVVRPSVHGTANVLQSVKKNLISIRRYVHFSSVAAIHSLDQPEDHVFVDTDWNTWSTVEKDAYGYAKTQAEKLVWDDPELQQASSSLQITVLNPAIVLGPCLCKAHTRSSAFFIRQIIYGNPIVNYNGSFVDVRDVAIAATLAFTRDGESVGGKRFILSATKPFNVLLLNNIVQKVHPWIKGSPPMYSSSYLTFIFVLSQIPFLSRLSLMTEFQRTSFQRLFELDATQSREVLGVKYTSMEDTCRDAVDSMKPFLKVKNWSGLVSRSRL